MKTYIKQIHNQKCHSITKFYKISYGSENIENDKKYDEDDQSSESLKLRLDLVQNYEQNIPYSDDNIDELIKKFIIQIENS